MKINTLFVLTGAFFSASLLSFVPLNAQSPLNIVGAWQTDSGGSTTTLICTENYFSIAIYDVDGKTFTGTYGGSYEMNADGYTAHIEFHSLNPEMVGNQYTGKAALKSGVLTLIDESGSSDWKRLDDGTPGKLSGAWLITGRMREGQMSKMTPGARRTMKILSGTRFQWIAYNVDTKEFSGTGGGTYTTQNGKYTEHIEFFSRDNTRVGASLTFEFSLEDGHWRHKGSSSKGDPIDEVWTKREKIGL